VVVVVVAEPGHRNKHFAIAVHTEGQLMGPRVHTGGQFTGPHAAALLRALAPALTQSRTSVTGKPLVA